MDELNPLAMPSFDLSNYSQNPQITQKWAKPKAKPNYDDLPIYQRLAVKLRLLGQSYQLIEEELNKAGYKYTEDSIRHWFSTGSGACKEIYESIKTKRATERLKDYEDTMSQLQESVSDAFSILRMAMTGHDVTGKQIAAAESILDRAGYGRHTRVDSTAILHTNIQQSSMEKMADALKTIARRSETK